ncbi:hypothetical protein RB595_000742 [Gaeumannomyces hyphopodioides]
MPTAKDDDRRRSRSPASRPRRDHGSSRDDRDRDDRRHRYRDRDRDRAGDTDSQSRDRRRQDGESSSRSHKHRSSKRQRSTSRSGRRDRRSREDEDSHSRPKRPARPTAATMMGPVDDDDDDDGGDDSKADEPAGERILPYDARTLSRHDYAAFRPLFAHYLDLHAQTNIKDLGERELRHRWRSFVKRWNAGKLSEGWYEPEMFQRVVRMWVEEKAGDVDGNDDDDDDDDDGYDRPAVSGDDRGDSPAVIPGRSAAAGAHGTSRALKATSKRGGTSSDDDDGSGDDDDDFGPPPPPPGGAAPARRRVWPASSTRQGPGIPTMQDLEERRAGEDEARQAERRAGALARRAERAEQKERLDELAPRADAGTRERRLEKRRELNEKLRGFREGSAGAADDVGDGELMGGGDGADDYRRALASQQRKKTDRELRREEEARARAEELQKRLQNYHAREDRVVGALKELAKQRFG